MYNCTKHDTGSAVARVTKDRAARPHLPSTVKNQLGRRRQRRQLLTIGQWNVRTLLDREGANRPERRTALVAMELAKYNIDIAALCETRFSESGQRKRGRPRVRFKDTIKRNLKRRDIKIDSWTSLSQQRDKWRATVK